ncbi:hypothetical protein FDG2_0587 [Candidatus Protofrankia californiensis]|uniref:HTH cro/C1-type domain-containing protein n=1 Tax=Candidatus Protofrankia californiensis TaxID=1839754 RepID=A0A1C3NTY6_9ACTN|nr:hypothetical protein FDG2_0587 [Candidatus Protofrankia californiensis]
MNPAMIRKAARMTRTEVAKKLGVGQAAVSRLENREDMLLSTCSRHFATAVGPGVGFSSSCHIWAFAQASIEPRRSSATS